jgi:hypothetical protein
MNEPAAAAPHATTNKPSHHRSGLCASESMRYASPKKRTSATRNGQTGNVDFVSVIGCRLLLKSKVQSSKIDAPPPRDSLYETMEQNLVPILQAAISPVILISGGGLLLLSMTNRLGRVIDRSRELARSHRQAGPAERARLERQLRILSQRGESVRLAITFCALSTLLAAALVIAVFVTALFQWRILALSVILFVACLLCLVTSLIFFLRDINLSLAALKLELEVRNKGTPDD